MFIRRNTVIKLCVAALIGTFLYCETLIYHIHGLYWHDLQCQNNDDTCTKILFIADPQIQGDITVPPPSSYLINWDVDRYLSSTFSLVISHFKPDVLVYLGDLMDEGSISTAQQFHKYVKRLFNIFDVPYPVVQVWLPGDNDIGGENEAIKYDKIKLFNAAFSQDDVVKFRNISFYKVNAITRQPLTISEGEDNNFKIMVSHYPLMIYPAYSRKLHDRIHPNIYFCAHDHESKYMKQTKNFTRHYPKAVPFLENRVMEIPFDGEDLYEVYVPTCSYRMGTSNIGYGAAILDNNNQKMRYTVFWSPKRFPSLFLYLTLLVIVLLYGVACCLYKVCSRCRSRGSKIPLYSKL